MRWRPPDFAADARNPFQHDRLDRTAEVTEFCEELTQADLPLLVAVDGEWGSGKSAFVQMCAAHLTRTFRTSVAVVQFNAWRQSYTAEPLLDLTSCITHELSRGDRRTRLRIWGRKLRRTSRLLGDGAVAALSRGVVDPRSSSEDSTNAWKRAHKRIDKFQQLLARAAEHRPVYVFVDELDRCHPEYAMRLLEQARFVFDVPHVCIILAVNRGALEQSLSSIYGDEYDAERYLRRFIDYSHQLAGAHHHRVTELLQQRFRDAGCPAEVMELLTEPVLNMVSLVARTPKRSIRDLDVAVRVATRVLSDVTEHHQAPTKEHEPTIEEWREFAMALVMLRVMHPQAYNELCLFPTSGETACAALHESLGREYQHRLADPSVTAALFHLSVSLLAFGSRAREGTKPRYEERRFAAAFDESQLGQLLAAARRRHMRYLEYGELLPINRWVTIIDREMTTATDSNH